MDVLPKNEYKIKKDIMTPHYQQGYTDDGVITPIEFLTVENTTFRFVLRINKKSFSKDYNSKIKIKEGKNIKDFIIEEMIEMINTHGIGAKTSVGYGYFEKITKDECLLQSRENDKRIIKEVEKEKDDYIKKVERFKEEKYLNSMTESKRKLYIAEKINDSRKRKEELKKLFNNVEKEKLDSQDIVRLAKLIKNELENEGQWKYKLGKNGKKDKAIKRIEKICNILNINLP